MWVRNNGALSSGVNICQLCSTLIDAQNSFNLSQFSIILRWFWFIQNKLLTQSILWVLKWNVLKE
jgi:hypothetical protein